MAGRSKTFRAPVWLPAGCNFGGTFSAYLTGGGTPYAAARLFFYQNHNFYNYVQL
jgi:hypothetical protein